MPLKDKVAIVTGATSGFGRATAEVFAEDGARVVAVARGEEAGRRMEAAVRAGGGELTFVPGDVRRTEDCRRAVEHAVDAYGRLDVLVNNAGSAGRHPVAASHEVSEEDWDDVVDTNLKGAFFLCRYALEHMRRQRDGAILNISSINAVHAVARMPAYNASKAALLHLTRTLAVEYSHEGIRVNAVVLGGGPTPMSDAVADEMARVVRGPEHVREPSSTRTPLDGFARLLAVLCGDETRLITGAVIPVDRGITAGLLTSTMIYLRQAGMLPTPSMHLLEHDPEPERR